MKIATLQFLFMHVLLMSIVHIEASNHEELPMVVLIPSRNNNQDFQGKKRYKLNLDSVFSQQYSNYRILYIDDHSDDGTSEEVQKYVKEKNQSARFTLIANEERFGPSRNRFMGIHLCNDLEIVVLLDGDDFFPHQKVLSTINKAYQENDIWLTYSQFKQVPGNGLSGGKATPQSVIDKNSYREFGWYFHSLKTFYAGLFKQVKFKDLLYEGKFYPISSDLAEMLPMMEMSGGRFKYIPDILYCATQYPNNEMHVFGRQLMAKMSAHILKSKPYEPLKETFKKQRQPEIADVVVMWSYSAKRLGRLLKSINEMVQNCKGDIFVLHEKLWEDPEAFQKLIDSYPTIRFVLVSDQSVLPQVLVKLLRESEHDYVFFANEKKHFTRTVDLQRMISLFNAIDASTFYLALDLSDIHSKEKPLLHFVQNSLEVAPKIFACEIDLVKAFKNHNPFGMTLYRKSDMQNILIKAIENSKMNLNEIIKEYNSSKKNIGLCFESKRSD
jgi:glycosyltransferase involved in cell wall biosynthesis